MGYNMPHECERDIRLMLLALGVEECRMALTLSMHMEKCTEEHIQMMERIISLGIVLNARELAVSGQDLQELGMQGEEIGRCLSYLLKSVALSEIENERCKLINAAEEFRAP